MDDVHTSMYFHARAPDHDPPIWFLKVIVRASLIGVGPAVVLLSQSWRQVRNSPSQPSDRDSILEGDPRSHTRGIRIHFVAANPRRRYRWSGCSPAAVCLPCRHDPPLVSVRSIPTQHLAHM